MDKWVPIRYVTEFLMTAADGLERMFDPKDGVSMAYAHGYKAAAIETRKMQGLTVDDIIMSCKEVEATKNDEAIPVVRCRDCAHCRETTDGFYFCDEWSDYTEPGVYCSYGKRI